MQRGGQAERNAGGGRKGHREQQHQAVDLDLPGPRQLERRQARDRPDPPDRQHGAYRPACRRQDQALDQQLLNEASAPSSQGRSHGELARPEGGTRQQQTRHIGADDEQDEHDRTHE
jgi:hypothetical protein